jgi:putative ABC transport system substrate-binding protein
LAETGFTEGRDFTVDYRWAEGNLDRLPGLAAELVSDHVAVIFASGGVASARAAMQATSSIPIIFSLGDDPVRLGLVSSINRPTGNVTGVTFNFTVLGARRAHWSRPCRRSGSSTAHPLTGTQLWRPHSEGGWKKPVMPLVKM